MTSLQFCSGGKLPQEKSQAESVSGRAVIRRGPEQCVLSKMEAQTAFPELALELGRSNSHRNNQRAVPSCRTKKKKRVPRRGSQGPPCIRNK